MIRILFILLFLPIMASAQNNVFKGAGISYTAGIPTYTPGTRGAEVAIDTATGYWYEYNQTTAVWAHSGYRIQAISGCVPPAYTPGKMQSYVVINACDSLYYYRGGAWNHLNAGGGGGGSQTLTLSGDTLSISGGNSVILPADVIGTDDQNLSLSGDSLLIESGTGVDLSGYLDNTDTSGYNSAFVRSNDTLYMTDGAGQLYVVLPAAVVDTDNQTVDTFEIASNTLRLSLEDDGQPFKTVDLSGYLDNTDAQTLTIDSTTVSGQERFTVGITGGNTISFDVDLDTDTDDQTVDTFEISANTLRLSLQDDGQPFKTVDLSGYLDNTDAQTLSVSNDTLTISGGNSVVLPTGSGSTPSVISPSQITSDQDNYNPTGFAAATVVRISGDNGIRAITGFAAQTDGEEKTIINVGSFPLYFPGEHPDSDTANRITLDRDFILFPKQSCRIVYDGTPDRWYVVGENTPERNTAYYSWSASSTAAGDWGQIGFVAINSGQATNSESSLGYPRTHSVSSASTSNGGGALYFVKGIPTQMYYAADAMAYTTWSFYLPVLSNGTETYTQAVQLINGPTSTSLEENNTIGVRYSHGINSGKFELFTQGNTGTESTADLGVTVAANTIYTVTICHDKANSEARAYINGTFRGRVNAQMPTTTYLTPRIVLIKSAGTTARSCNIVSGSAGTIYP